MTGRAFARARGARPQMATKRRAHLALGTALRAKRRARAEVPTLQECSLGPVLADRPGATVRCVRWRGQELVVKITSCLAEAHFARLMGLAVHQESDAERRFVIYMARFPHTLHTYRPAEAASAAGQRRVARAVMRAVAQLGARGVVHRDLSRANIMLDADGAVRLIDYERATAGERSTVHRSITTLDVAPPEALFPRDGRATYTHASDVWSAAVAVARWGDRRAEAPCVLRLCAIDSDRLVRLVVQELAARGAMLVVGGCTYPARLLHDLLEACMSDRGVVSFYAGTAALMLDACLSMLYYTAFLGADPDAWADYMCPAVLAALDTHRAYLVGGGAVGTGWQRGMRWRAVQRSSEIA